MDHIYSEAARAINELLEVNTPHAHHDMMVRDFPASYVRIWWSQEDVENCSTEARLREIKVRTDANPEGSRQSMIRTTILFIEDTIDVTHQPDIEDIPYGFELDLTDPNCWETLLRWMKDESLTPKSTVLTGELAA